MARKTTKGCEKMVICNEEIANSIAEELKNIVFLVMDIEVIYIPDGRYYVKAVVYKIALNFEELSIFIEIAKKSGTEFQIVCEDYFRIDYY